MVTNSTRLMQHLELWRLWLVKGALKGEASETLCLRETLAMFSSPIILGKAMNEFNESCVFLGRWYTDNKIGDGLSISDKFQCFIGFTNFVVTVVYVVFLLPSNCIKSQWVPSADHTRYRENPPLTSTIIIEKDDFSIARLDCWRAIPSQSQTNLNCYFFLATNQRKIPIFGWFQYVSTKKITIFGAINPHRNPQLVTEVQRSLHGAMEATQRGQHPGEGQSLKPSPRATWRCHEKNHEEMVVSGWMMGEWWFNVGLMDVEWIWTRDFN